MPWHIVPGDDGFEWSLNMARAICLLLMGFPAFFFACMIAILMMPGVPRDQPALIVLFALLAFVITPASPYVRERVARAGIAVHLDDPRSHRRILPVYSTFAAATIAGFLVAQTPALFGFIASAFTRDLAPLAVGSLGSYFAWAVLWPRRSLWARWTLQAKIGSEGGDATLEGEGL
jgi:hypothetical protein